MQRSCLVLLITLLFYGQWDGANAQNDDNIFIFYDAEAFLTMLNASTNSAINMVLPPLQALPRELEAKSLAVLEAAQADTQTIYDNLKTSLQALLQKYVDQGKNIQHCIDIYVPLIDRLPQDVTDEIQVCLRRSVILADEFVRLSTEQIEASRNEISRMRLRIDECKILPDGTGCIILVRTELSGLVVVLPRGVSEDAERATVLVSALEQQFPECHVDRVNSVNIVGNDMLNYLEVCADEL